MLRRITKRNTSKQRGFSLLEVLIASVVFLIGATAVLGTITVAAMMNAGHGTQGARTTEYATAKMEDWMSQTYSTLSAETGTTTDYIVETGALATYSSASTGATYKRQSTISVSGSVVTITVVVTSLQVPKWGTAANPIAPSTTLIAQKMNYNPNAN